VAELRMNLLPEEQERYREVSRLSAEAMEAAVRAVRPGMNEYEIAACWPKRRTTASCCRSSTWSPPMSASSASATRCLSDKKMEKYAMLVMCGRKYGLVTSVTRLVHFGPLPDELKKKQEAVTQIDAQVIATRAPA
jgi:Xaa-Pro aminopeptidase